MSTLKDYIDSLYIKEVDMTSEDLTYSFNSLRRFIEEQTLDPNVVGIKFKHTFKVPAKANASNDPVYQYQYFKTLSPALDVVSDICVTQNNSLIAHRVVNPHVTDLEDKGYVSTLPAYRVLEIPDTNASEPLEIAFTAYVLDLKERKHTREYCPLI